MIEGEIKNATERIEDLIKMGKTLGFSPLEWTVLLKFAAEEMERRYDVKIHYARIENPNCNCEKCKAKRAREGFHVVKEPDPGVSN